MGESDMFLGHSGDLVRETATTSRVEMGRVCV